MWNEKIGTAHANALAEDSGVDIFARETQHMASKPSPAERTQTLADEGRSQQPPEVTPASAPAVAQPIQPQPLADEVADEGHAQQPLEVTPASAPAVVQPIQPLADAGGTETIAVMLLPVGAFRDVLFGVFR